MIKAEIYNYSTHQMLDEVFTFPMSEDKINKTLQLGEVMVESDERIVGFSLSEFNEMATKIEEAGLTDEDVNILEKTYLFSEIAENAENALIINFNEEVSALGWSNMNFINDEDKGRLLYGLGYASFPVNIPEELEDYMDYGRLWRDIEVTDGMRTVITPSGCYIVSLGL